MYETRDSFDVFNSTPIEENLDYGMEVRTLKGAGTCMYMYT